jgi:hypothetical protein
VTRQPNAIDFWRGFALVTIFINHIPGLFFERFTQKNFSFSDSADLFVFLAGWALRLSVGGPDGGTSTGQVLTRLGGRVITIYAAQLLLSSLAIAMLAGAATYFEKPVLLSWFNVAAIFYDPINAHLGLAMLTYQLGYFDILPLYVVLMIAAPLIVLIYRLAPAALLPVSLAIYLWALVFEVSPPTWPTKGTWFFNPLAWQFLFVLGFLFAGEEGLGGFVRRHQQRLMLAAAPVLLAATLMMLFKWWPGAGDVPEPTLLFTVEKSYLTPIRLIQFLSLVVVFAGVYPYIARPLPTLSEFLSLLGRNSLPVFCVASLLSVGFQILRFVYTPDIAMDTAILVTGFAILGFTAWVSEWRAARSSARSAQPGADARQFDLPLAGRADAQAPRQD